MNNSHYLKYLTQLFMSIALTVTTVNTQSKANLNFLDQIKMMIGRNEYNIE